MNQNIPHIAPQGVEPLPRLFYGWRVVGFVFVIMTFASGLGFYNISVILSAALFLKPGPWAMGLAHDWLGGYGGAFAFAGLVSLLSAGLFHSAGPIPKPDE